MSQSFSSLPAERKLQLLLIVAQNSAKRAQDALSAVAIANANELAFAQLADAILRIRNTHFLKWEELRVELGAPCSVEMLKSIVARRKNPSKSLYERLRLAIDGYSQRNSLEVPNLSPYLE